MTTTSEAPSRKLTAKGAATRERIVIARQNIDAAKRILVVVQAKVTNGVSSNLDLAQEQSLVATQEARLPGLIEQEREELVCGVEVRGEEDDGDDRDDRRVPDLVRRRPSRAS